MSQRRLTRLEVDNLTVEDYIPTLDSNISKEGYIGVSWKPNVDLKVDDLKVSLTFIQPCVMCPWTMGT